MDIEGVACWPDAALNLNHTSNFLNGVSDSRRQCPQELVVIGIKFNLDRLRDAGEVADQIFHQLQKLDRKTGNMFFDLRADVVHHLLYTAARERLKPNEKVASICFGDATTEL